MRKFSYIGLMKLADPASSEGTSVLPWHDYSGLKGLESWQLPDQTALDRFMEWRDSRSGQPYDPLSSSPRFGSFRLAPGAGAWKGLVDERRENGSDVVDFYPFVHAGFIQQKDAGKTYGKDMSGVTDESMSEDARVVADLLARQWAERRAQTAGNG